MQVNIGKTLLNRFLLLAFLGLGMPLVIVPAQYPLLNPNIGPSSLKTGTQPFSSMTISGANANPVVMNATSIDNLTVNFTYSPAAEDYNVVNYSIDFTKLTPAAPIPAAALQAGVSVQVSLVEAANVLSFPNINSFQKSYFWNSGPSAINTLIVLVVGADGTVYAAGACAAYFIPQYAPIAYQVVINSGLDTRMSTTQIPMTTSTIPGVKIQSGVTSTSNMVTYPLFNSNIWGVGTPTNPAAFSAVSVHSDASSKVVMGINNLQNVNVSFNYTSTATGAVTYAIDLTKYGNISEQVLQNGLFLQIDLVPAAQAASYAAAPLYQTSYFWGGPSATNTMYVSLVDASGNIYAAGACTGAIPSNYTPTSYVVTINSGTDSQMQTQPIAVNGTSTPVVAFQSGVTSTPNMVSYPLFNSVIWGVTAPTNPTSFSELSILGNAQNSITLGVDVINNIAVNFDYDTALSAVTYSVDLTQYNSIPDSVLQAGLFLKIDLVAAANATSYPSANLISHSYFWGGPSAVNTMYVSLVDASGNVYAAGGCTGSIVGQYTPTAYTVIINSSTLDQLSTLPISISAGNAQGVMIKSGVASAPASLIAYPVFMSTISEAATPTNPTTFAAVKGQTTGMGVVTVEALDIESIFVGFNYGSNNSQVVTYEVDIKNIAAITPAVLQAGLYIKTDLVPAAQSATYPGVNMIPRTYFWGSPAAVNTMFVSLVDAQGTIYAIGGCTGTIASQYIPSNYVVTVQGKNNVAVTSAPVSFAASTVPAVLVQLKTTSQLSQLGALSYSALKSSLSSLSIPLSEVTGQGTLTSSDTLSFAFGAAVGFAMPKTTWANTAIPNLYEQLNAVSGFNLSAGVIYVMLAFDGNNNLISDLTGYSNISGMNFYLFAYDAQGVSLFPTGIALPVATMGNVTSSTMISNTVDVILNTSSTPFVVNKTVNYPASLIVTSSTSAVSAGTTSASSPASRVINLLELHKQVAAVTNNSAASVVVAPAATTSPIVNLLELHKQIAAVTNKSAASAATAPVTTTSSSSVNTSVLPAVSTLKPLFSMSAGQKLSYFTYSPNFSDGTYSELVLNPTNLGLINGVISTGVNVILQCVLTQSSAGYTAVLTAYNATTSVVVCQQNFGTVMGSVANTPISGSATLTSNTCIGIYRTTGTNGSPLADASMQVIQTGSTALIQNILIPTVAAS